MSNYFPQEQHKVFELNIALENLGEQDEFVKNMAGNVVSIFDKDGQIDQLIKMYKDTNWRLVGSKDYHNFENLAHSVKGLCRYLGLTRMQSYLERLQFCIRDNKIIQVGTCMDEVLEWCPSTQQQLLNYLNKTDQPIRYYKPVQTPYDQMNGIKISQKTQYIFNHQTSTLYALQQQEPYQPKDESIASIEPVCMIM